MGEPDGWSGLLVGEGVGFGGVGGDGADDEAGGGCLDADVAGESGDEVAGADPLGGVGWVNAGFEAVGVEEDEGAHGVFGLAEDCFVEAGCKEYYGLAGVGADDLREFGFAAVGIVVDDYGAGEDGGLCAAGEVNCFYHGLEFIVVELVGDVDYEAVVGELNAFGESERGFNGGADAVAHVGYVGDSGFHFGNDVEGLLERQVGVVFLESQGVDDQGVDSADEFQGGVGDCFCVGDVGEVAHFEANDGEAMVHDGQGHYVEVGNVEGFGGYFGYVECGHAGVGGFGEAVGHAVAQVAGNVGSAVDGESVAHCAVGPEVVNAANVVVVAVCNEQCFEHRGALGEHLLAEVGAAVNEDVFVFIGYHRRATQAFVVVVAAAAGRTVTHDLRYSGAGAGSKESQFHNSSELSLKRYFTY